MYLLMAQQVEPKRFLQRVRNQMRMQQPHMCHGRPWLTGRGFALIIFFP